MSILPTGFELQAKMRRILPDTDDDDADWLQVGAYKLERQNLSKSRVRAHTVITLNLLDPTPKRSLSLAR